MTEIQDMAIRAFAEAKGVAPEALDLDHPIDDEEDETVVCDLCDRLEIEPRAMFPAVGDLRRSELAVGGLRRLAPFSPRAAERLAGMRMRWEVVTIGSFIRSLEERRLMGSGRWEEGADPPIPPASALLRFAAWTLIPGAGLTMAFATGCDPACRNCTTLAETWPVGFGLPALVVGAWHLAMLGAALHAMRQPPVAEAPL